MQKRNSRKFFRIRLEEMIQTLRHEIHSGSIAIGSYLPSESDLEVRFGLSNASVRNGLKVLVDEGLIEKIPRVGNRVIPPVEEGRTTIKFGYVNTIPKLVEMQELLNEFGKRYPHIDVQPLELSSGNYSTSLKEYLQSEIMDVVLMNNNNYQDFWSKAARSRWSRWRNSRTRIVFFPTRSGMVTVIAFAPSFILQSCFVIINSILRKPAYHHPTVAGPGTICSLMVER